MYRFKTLTGHCLWARHIAAQATEVAVRVGVLNRMGVKTVLVRNPFVSPEIMPFDAMASSRSIYGTTLPDRKSVFEQPDRLQCSLPFSRGDEIGKHSGLK
ncbi:MAG: hypothetical protein E5299_02358 [Burkholderia gladioli]|nr:MAG: hypothetical protein E5299_02358 [Burkholderia gladioli]